MTKALAGVSAPDFTMKDLHGQPVQLSSFRGRKHVLLVLNRGFY